MRSVSRFARRVVMHLHDDVGVPRQVQADPISERMGLVAGRPAPHRAEDRIPREPREAGVTRPRILLVSRSAEAPDVDVSERMVNDARVSRFDLDGRDPGILGQVGWQHETTVDVSASCGYLERLRHLEDEVRRSERPVVRPGEAGRRWRLAAA